MEHSSAQSSREPYSAVGEGSVIAMSGKQAVRSHSKASYRKRKPVLKGEQHGLHKEQSGQASISPVQPIDQTQGSLCTQCHRDVQRHEDQRRVREVRQRLQLPAARG